MSAKSLAKSLPLFTPINRLRRRALLAMHTLKSLGGVHPRSCPICGFSGYFHAHGSPPRWDALCPKCDSIERHRLFALALKQHPGLIRGTVVHWAPEPGVASLVRPLAGEYLSADKFRKADLALDIESIALADESVDVFVASHVLEHVDDGNALKELHRCLKPGGSLVVMVPLVEAWSTTYERSDIQSPTDRELHFGQFDHVRFYGRDIRDRISNAGFSVAEFCASGSECADYGLWRGEVVLIATKR